MTDDCHSCFLLSKLINSFRDGMERIQTMNGIKRKQFLYSMRNSLNKICNQVEHRSEFRVLERTKEILKIISDNNYLQKAVYDLLNAETIDLRGRC